MSEQMPGSKVKGSEQKGELNHFSPEGLPRMVDVGVKPETVREACAEGLITMQPETQEIILNRKVAKGDVLAVAQLAGIMAAKQTSSLIPLCHNIPLDGVDIVIEPLRQHGASSSVSALRITATVRCTAKTGAEMEALTAVSVAALTVYDMCKAIDRAMEIGDIHLLSKSGGKSGNYRRAE